jgi:hypothetical protein
LVKKIIADSTFRAKATAIWNSSSLNIHVPQVPEVSVESTIPQAAVSPLNIERLSDKFAFCIHLLNLAYFFSIQATNG